MITSIPARFGRLYLGNKMAGIPYCNAPWFDSTAEILRRVPGVTEVFNPADHDRLTGFEPLNCPKGSDEEAYAAGFVRNEALRADWNYIADHSDGLIVGESWAESTGTISEIACHQALDKPVWELPVFLSYYHLPDDIFKEDFILPRISDMFSKRIITKP